MPDEKKKEFDHRMPGLLDLLWDTTMPAKAKILMVLGMAYPRSVDTGSLLNVISENNPVSRRKMQYLLRDLAKDGKIRRSNGQNHLIVAGLGVPDEQHLKSYRALYGRLKGPGTIPMPQKEMEEKSRGKNLEAIPYRFTCEQVEWLDALDLFGDTLFWSRQLPRRVEGSTTLMAMSGKVVEVLGDLAEDVPVGHLIVMQAVHRVHHHHQSGKKAVTNPCGLLQKILKDLAAGDLSHRNDAWLAWLREGLEDEPYGERLTVAEHLEAPVTPPAEPETFKAPDTPVEPAKPSEAVQDAPVDDLEEASAAWDDYEAASTGFRLEN